MKRNQSTQTTGNEKKKKITLNSIDLDDTHGVDLDRSDKNVLKTTTSFFSFYAIEKEKILKETSKFNLSGFNSIISFKWKSMS